jgi:hypothetical protein
MDSIKPRSPSKASSRPQPAPRTRLLPGQRAALDRSEELVARREVAVDAELLDLLNCVSAPTRWME